jgi:hypothetical protein
MIVTVKELLASSSKEFVCIDTHGNLLWLQHRWVLWSDHNQFHVDENRFEMARGYGDKFTLETFPPLQHIGSKMLWIAKAHFGPSAGQVYVFVADRASNHKDLTSCLVETFDDVSVESAKSCSFAQVGWSRVSKELQEVLHSTSPVPVVAEAPASRNAPESASLVPSQSGFAKLKKILAI